MRIAQWKTSIWPALLHIPSIIRIEDANIEWIEVIFEQTGRAAACPPHAHTWYELNYILEGEMWTGFGESLLPIREGEFFLIPPDAIHEHRYQRDHPHEGLCIRWRLQPADSSAEADPAESFFQRLSDLRHWQPGIYQDRYGIKGILERLFEDALAGQSPTVLRLHLVQLLETLSWVRMPDRSPVPLPTANVDRIVNKIDVYLADYQSSRLDVNELAASLHVSYGHLSRVYRRRTGKTLVQRLNEIRLERACQRLAESGEPVQTVARQSGFLDLPHFNRLFKKTFGCSPLDYRKKQKGTPVPRVPD